MCRGRSYAVRIMQQIQSDNKTSLKLNPPTSEYQAKGYIEQ